MTVNTARDPVAVALRLLAVRSHAVGELKVKLKKKGFDETDISRTVDYLAGIGSLDDERFAREVLASRTRNKNWGPRKVAADLAVRGVAQDIIRRVVGSVDGEAQAALAKEAIARWLRKTGCRMPLGQKEFAKAVRHLTARGFGLDVVLNGLRRYDDIDAG
ncbi:MAG: regulatory protein RecX [Deltaproteobacteria bacterium]|nr:regulatory protein RecX [Deltaproteobacteria bacterium]